MGMIIGALAAGLLAGLLPGAAKAKKVNSKLGTLGLLLLLGTLGVELGGDEQLMSSIAQIGFSATLLASGAVVGSILFLLPLRRLFAQADRKGDEAA